MTTATKKKKTRKKAEVKAEAKKVVQAAKKVEEKPNKPNIIDYSPKDKSPQLVRPFGKDKLSQKAQAAFVIAKHLLSQEESFSSQDAIAVVLKKTSVDLLAVYPNSAFAGSPLHEGLHAISKGETLEKDDKEDGSIVDRFARGERGLIFKEGKVGPSQKGRYHRNPKRRYKSPTPAELKKACETIVSLISSKRKPK